MLSSTKISTEDAKKYDKVIGKFDEHFKVRKNVIFERARFNKRDQLEGETAEEYITTLYGLVKTCDYPADLVDEMLRDRLIVGILDQPFADRLQTKADLTLDSAKKPIRQKEAVREHRQELGNDSRKGHLAVEDVTRRSAPRQPRGASRSSTPHFKGKPQNHVYAMWQEKARS